MKFLFVPILTFLSFMVNVDAQISSIHNFSVKALNGGNIDFSAYKGKKILVVNVASQCGYTPQYAALEKLYTDYKKKLVIVGFPANNFGGQEPGTDNEIAHFCKSKYRVTFPMASKISVKGEDMAAIYQWLTTKSQNGVLDATVSWNFNKFLLDEHGKLLAHFPSDVKPDSEEITKWLK